MKLIFKNCDDEHFLRMLNKGMFTKDDVVFGEIKDMELSKQFQRDKLFKIEKNNEISSAIRIFLMSRRLKIEEFLYIAEKKISDLKIVVLFILSFLSHALLIVDTGDRAEKIGFSKVMSKLGNIIVWPIISIAFIVIFCLAVINIFPEITSPAGMLPPKLSMLDALSVIFIVI